MGGRFVVFVLDGCGIGGALDAALFGDEGSNTVANTARARALRGRPLHVPHLAAMGLARTVQLAGVEVPAEVAGGAGRMRERSPAKDTTAGHWEMMGLPLKRPFPTYPDGFPEELVAKISAAIGHELIGNEVASGTEIVARLGAEAFRRRAIILYTSADSVFQMAAHESAIPVEELYKACETARGMLTGEHGVGRVIARPFIGEEGAFVRTERRRDFSLPPTGPTVIDALAEGGVVVFGAGKVGEIFACRGFAGSEHTPDNDATVDLAVRHMREQEGFIFANLGDFDTLWGHRNDVEGFARGLEGFDRRLPEIMDTARKGDIVVVTADHGCDPTTPSTDHSREDVPLLAWGPGLAGRHDLGTREGFFDLGATVADFFGVRWAGPGRSFLGKLE